MDKVKRIEKGWAGHLIVSNRCTFRRHTLLEYGDVAISVSTVGNWVPDFNRMDKVETIGSRRYFETMAFKSLPVTEEEPWKDPDHTKRIAFREAWYIPEPGKYAEANRMHDKVVQEIILRLRANDQFALLEE